MSSRFLALRSFYLRALVLLVSIVAILLLGEVFVRLYFRGQFAPRPPFYVTDPVLGWRPRPELRHRYFGADFSMEVTTDRNGFRLAGNAIASQAEQRIILACGDSYTFAWGVEGHQSFCAHLERRLQAEHGVHWRVANGGVPGYSTLQSVLKLVSDLEILGPDRIKAILFTHCENDPSNNCQPLVLGLGLGLVSVVATPPQPFLGHSLHLVNLARSVADRRIALQTDAIFTGDLSMIRISGQLPEVIPLIDVRSADLTPREWDWEKQNRGVHLTEVQTQVMRVVLASLHEIVAKRNLLIVHQFLPTSPRTYVDEMIDLIRSSQSTGNRMIIIDTGSGRSGKSLRLTNEHSGGHLNPAAQSEMGERLYQVLLSHGLLKDE